MHKISNNRHKLFLAMSAASLSMLAQGTLAQDQQTITQIEAPALEETLVLGRQQSGAQSVIQERMEDAFSSDLLDSEQIGRTGDSNVAVALTRVTGVTLNQGKFVYVRGLGERYSSVQLNGAQVPSPELTRNVLPLDIIPSSIVDSLKVQKSYSPELPAAFGGGNVDIRTKSVPDEFVLNLLVGTGTNSENDAHNLRYAGGESNKGLPSAIATALDTYLGQISIQNIRATSHVDTASARQINNQLALSLNRDIGIREEKSPIDHNLSMSLGNSWDLGDNWTLGGIVNGSQKVEWRNKDQVEQGVSAPETNYKNIHRTQEDRKELVSGGLGIKYQEAHEIQLSYMQIQNATDEAAIVIAQSNNDMVSDGRQKITYQTSYQERNLDVAQALGKHSFDQLSGNTLGNIDVDWFYSDSSVETNIPGATNIVGDNVVDPLTGEVLSTALTADSTNTFSFLNLKDDVLSYGWNAKLPLSFDAAEVVFSGGYSYNDKSRKYYGYNVWLNTGNVPGVLQGTPADVFTDANISNPTNGFEVAMSQGLGTESYIAAQMNDSFYGMVDITFDDSFRITGGARYEDFRTATLPIDLLDYQGDYIRDLIDDLQDPNQKFASRDDDWYPSLALTYMNDGFLGAETFQLRGSYSKTLVRPDLRELSDVVFIDPETNFRIQGNPYLLSSTLDNYDLRAEFYFDNGNNLTATLFYKDVTDPIEQQLIPGSDQNKIIGFQNAISGKIYGLELEGLLNLDYGLFVSSNLTLSDSEVVSPDNEGYTNPVRTMTGQAPYVLNLQLGYDSDNGEHGATLAYNLVGEKLFFAAIGSGHDDAFEQPFNSLDFTYSYYPTEEITLKLKLKNLLNEDREITQVNSAGTETTTLKQTIGTSVSFDVSYNF